MLYLPSDGTFTPALFDSFCEEVCVGPLDDYYECVFGEKGYADYLCVKQNNAYCVITYTDIIDECDGCNDETCPDTCRSCLRPRVSGLSCCLDQYRSYSFINITELEMDNCGNTYNICSSGGAIAVPTVLTALLLMVMAAIVM